MKKTSLSSAAISQLKRSMEQCQVRDLSKLTGVQGSLLAIDPKGITITDTHKGWSYAQMVLKALQRGEIKEETLIREFTSGRGGEAAGKIAKLLGISCEIVMPENITPEREATLGRIASLILTPEKDWLLGSMNYAHEATAQDANAFLVNQSANQANVIGLARVFQSAVKIVGAPNYFVSTTGTGGTTAAFGSVKPRGSKNIGIDPSRSPSTKALKESWEGDFEHQAHKYWGGGAGAASPIVSAHINLIDEVHTVDWEVALEIAKWLGRKGLKVGLSSGGNIKAAMDIIGKNPGATVLTIIHDFHDAYRSMGL